MALNSFNTATAGDGTAVISTIDSSALISAIQTAHSGDIYFDTTGELGPVYVYYTHEAGRQEKKIVHDAVSHQGSISWSAYAQDGTWQKSKVKAFDRDGAFVYLNRTNIGTGEDLTHSAGVINLNV